MVNKHSNTLSDVECYAQRFSEIEEGQVITSAISKKTKTQEFFTFTKKDREWSMAWSDESLVQSQLKKYWFVSTKGDVISVRGEKPKYMRKDTNNKRGYIKYHTTVNGKKKSINGHALTAIVFRSCVMPDAQQSLNEQGIYSLGKQNDQNQTHHEETGNILDCNPKKQCITTGGDHRLLHAQRWQELVKSARRQADMSGQAIIIVPPFDVDAEGDQVKYNGTYIYRLVSAADTEQLQKWMQDNVSFVPVKVDADKIQEISGIEDIESITIEVQEVHT